MIEIHYREHHPPVANQPWTPSVHGVIRDDSDAILLHRREDNESWALPGGKLEPGESLVTCLKREMLEETGLQVQPNKLLGVFSSSEYVLSAGEKIFQPLLIVFLCNARKLSLKTNAESVSFMWMDKKNVEALDAFPLVKEIGRRVWAGTERAFFDESSLVEEE